ncbi:protein kinase family protein [Streptomyces bacillaris]|uniref:hypothetical protein n=1 Tax=Streptomyces bacillaris TaxID=68179 RepID=UPI0036FC6BDC
MNDTDWQFVRMRTADPDGGAVHVSADRERYRRTGGGALRAEAAFQHMVYGLGYPVPQVLEQGEADDGAFFVVEESLGGQSLHEMVLTRPDGGRKPADTVVDQLTDVSTRLLHAQAGHPVDAAPDALRQWVEQAGWTQNVFAENPDFDTPRVHVALDRAVDRLTGVPLVWGHLDYGLPNVLSTGVIDCSTTAWSLSATTSPWRSKSSRSRAVRRGTPPPPPSANGTWRRWTRPPGRQEPTRSARKRGSFSWSRACSFSR